MKDVDRRFHEFSPTNEAQGVGYDRSLLCYEADRRQHAPRFRSAIRLWLFRRFSRVIAVKAICFGAQKGDRYRPVPLSCFETTSLSYRENGFAPRDEQRLEPCRWE